MKKTIGAAIFTIWVLVASAFITHLWLTRPDMFPTFPPTLAEKLVSLYGAENAEQVSDLEIIIGFGFSIPLIALITFISLRALRYLKHS
ncbi:hypothetical protein [Agrobacterium larrymoorei]|uniref:Uncharacterized protein n=1 Tax=Agrobacterium larrymoorei TaxID=160699 RepID=A0A4D7DW94_9HYPH|nr:hypothetical protein [Agrobacterium larrymoorei]QCI98526.1 hypothetical protein CFBP5473_11855 [Agrobacterium larrymoorei]QYA06010.1 hypothetical protein J5285_07875 [Agrobacterium larrymoorei]